MSKSLTSVLVLASLATSCAIVDEVTEGFRFLGKFASGIARGEGEVVDDKQEGEWRYLSENGRVRAEGKYENDLQVGRWTYYYENGQKEYEGHLENSRREGRYQYWHPNGNPRATGHFVSGREFGSWTFWNERGSIAQRGPFESGLREGRWTSYHPEGTLAAEGLYADGLQVGRWRLVSPNGEESFAWTPMPENAEWVSDRWEDGTIRREGFLENGRQAGLWILNDRRGNARLVGSFENGIPHGRWAAFGPSGERIGEGNVELGRATGPWTIMSGGVPTELDATGFPPAAPFAGVWTDRQVAMDRGIDGALSIWLSEVGAPIDETARVAQTPPTAEEPTAEIAEAAVEVDVPVITQPFTVFEQSNFDDLVNMYMGAKEAATKLRSRYARVRGRSSSKGSGLIPEPGGDVDAGARYLGKPLQLTTYKNRDGADLDLSSFGGQKVVLVVLRGYSGQVCVYCTAQTKALYKSGAVESFKELGASLQIVYPGERNGLEAFRRAYASLNEAELPPYGVLYENDYIVSKMLDLEGSKVIPSTFILDEEGIVRFAYIGKSKEDRPPVTLLIDELKALNAPTN